MKSFYYYEGQDDEDYQQNYNSPSLFYFHKPNEIYKEVYSLADNNIHNNSIYILNLNEAPTKSNSKDNNDKENQKVYDEDEKSEKFNNFEHLTFSQDIPKLNEIKKGEKKEKNEKKDKKENKEKKEKKKCGRKRKRSSEDKIEHNKFSDDNVRRKCKHLVLKNTMKFLNYKINFLYNGNIGNGIFKKELQTINQSQKSDATINFNKLFIKKKLSEIFSEDISGRFTNLPHDHNKTLIKQLMDEKDEYKKEYFNKVFNLEFIDCLAYFRGEKRIDVLEGLKCFNDMKNEIINKFKEDGVDYYNTLKYYLDNFEQIINKKKARKSRKQNIQ